MFLLGQIVFPPAHAQLLVQYSKMAAPVISAASANKFWQEPATCQCRWALERMLLHYEILYHLCRRFASAFLRLPNLPGSGRLASQESGPVNLCDSSHCHENLLLGCQSSYMASLLLLPGKRLPSSKERCWPRDAAELYVVLHAICLDHRSDLMQNLMSVNQHLLTLS